MNEIILVNPEKPENTGFVARLCKNFNFELKLVNPEFNIEKCRKTANKAQNKLRNARIYSELGDSIKNNYLSIGTKMNRGKPIKEISSGEKVSLIIGRESSGLKNSELRICDQIAHIQTSNYASLNQSHAASIMMYQIFSN